jgi:hypothetical protein
MHDVGQAKPEQIAVPVDALALLVKPAPSERFVQATKDFDMPVAFG